MRIAIDGETKLPLRVQVFGTDNKIVFEVAYTSVDFTRPDDAEFVFNPPPGAKVTEIQPSDQTPSAQDRKQAEEARSHHRRRHRLDCGAISKVAIFRTAR